MDDFTRFLYLFIYLYRHVDSLLFARWRKCFIYISIYWMILTYNILLNCTLVTLVDSARLYLYINCYIRSNVFSFARWRRCLICVFTYWMTSYLYYAVLIVPLLHWWCWTFFHFYAVLLARWREDFIHILSHSNFIVLDFLQNFCKCNGVQVNILTLTPYPHP